MKLNKNNCKVEYTKGSGPGGQNRNKVETAVRITHIESGISVFICTQRTRGQNERIAWKELESKLKQIQSNIDAKKKKEYRDYKIHNTKTIRTYDFKKGIVKDHRTKKTASIKDILEKGDLDKLK